MLTLTQVEPRTPVDPVHTGSGGGSEYLITQPGSYYLTSNVLAEAGLHGINISASDVTLDLRGFSVIGSSSAYDGIYIHAGYTNVIVRNGNIAPLEQCLHVRQWRRKLRGQRHFGASECLRQPPVWHNTRQFRVVRDCNVENNGKDGINAANNCTVIGCTANRGSMLHCHRPAAAFLWGTIAALSVAPPQKPIPQTAFMRRPTAPSSIASRVAI